MMLDENMFGDPSWVAGSAFASGALSGPAADVPEQNVGLGSRPAPGPASTPATPDGELPGAWSDADWKTHPPIVRKLHYEFESWLGDAILEAFPCFIVTGELWEAIEHARLTGARIDRAETSTSLLFRKLYPGRKLPAFAGCGQSDMLARMILGFQASSF